jgi:hypothetical protein
MTDLTLESLGERLSRVERQNRLLRAAVILVVAVFAAMVCMGQVGVPEVVGARRFQMVDEQGRVRADIGMVDDNPVLYAYDEEGEARLGLGLSMFGDPRLGLFNEKGDPCAVLSLGTSGPSLNFMDGNGKPNAALEVWDGDSRLDLCDAEGKPRVSLDTSEDKPGLNLYDAAGELRASLTMFEGEPGLDLYDAAGKIRMAVAMLDGEPGLCLHEAAGGMRAALAMVEHGPDLVLYDATGKPRASLAVFEGDPGLVLYDAAGKTRAALGATSLETIKTGAITKRSESSLVLFDKEGKVLWKAPLD